MPEPATDRGSRLLLMREKSGVQHELAGRVVRAGDRLELALNGPGRSAVWVVGRYEWNFQSAEPPFFYLGLSGSNQELMIRLPSNALLRWPALGLRTIDSKEEGA